MVEASTWRVIIWKARSAGGDRGADSLCIPPCLKGMESRLKLMSSHLLHVLWHGASAAQQQRAADSNA